jgi:uncharacterized membrane protein
MSDAIPKLERHVRQWVTEGIISAEQGAAILARHPTRASSGWLLAYVLIGGVLCVAGVSLLIASNWQSIPALLKLAGVLVILAASTIIGVETQRRAAHRSIWECAYLVAAVFPLLGLMLVSQIFHLSGDTSGLLAVWCLAITPLAILSRSGSAFLVWVVAAYAWLGFVLTEKFHWPDMWQFFLAYAAAGTALAAVSQLWRRIHREDLRSIGEFIGAMTAAFALWLVGFDIDRWAFLWAGLFIAALGWIWLSMECHRPHQVNLGFVLIGLVILSTFLRLVGTMAQTGIIFLSGGVVLLVTAWGLNFLRRQVLRRMS